MGRPVKKCTPQMAQNIVDLIFANDPDMAPTFSRKLPREIVEEISEKPLKLKKNPRKRRKITPEIEDFVNNLNGHVLVVIQEKVKEKFSVMVSGGTIYKIWKRRKVQT